MMYQAIENSASDVNTSLPVHDALPAYPDDGDEFGLGFKLNHQNSFDSMTGQIQSIPTDNGVVSQPINYIPSSGSNGGPLEKKASIDYSYMSPVSAPGNNNYMNALPIDADLPGEGLRRLASLNEYRPLAGSALRKREAPVVEYTSDRVTELVSEPSTETLQSLPNKRSKLNTSVSSLPSNASLESQQPTTLQTNQLPLDDSVIQPQIDYVEMLQKNQEVSLLLMMITIMMMITTITMMMCRRH